MATEFYRTEVQKALRALIVAGPFYAVDYDATTKVPTVTVSDPINVNDHITPSSVVVNEVSATFAEAELQRRHMAFDRAVWQFQARVGFDQEVLLERFEAAVINPVPVVVRSAAVGRTRQVDLRLVNAEYAHPTQQEGHTGTNVTYTFEARLTPN